MRTLSDEQRSMVMGGALTERKIKIWEMEAGTGGCRRPSRGLHLQSSLPAGGSALAVGRGVAGVRTRGAISICLSSGTHPGKKRRLRGQISRDQNLVGQVICLSRRDLVDHVQGDCQGPEPALVSCTPPFLLPPPGSDWGYICHLNQITSHHVCFTSWPFAKEVTRTKVECHHGVALNFTATLMQSSPDMG